MSILELREKRTKSEVQRQFLIPIAVKTAPFLLTVTVCIAKWHSTLRIRDVKSLVWQENQKTEALKK